MAWIRVDDHFDEHPKMQTIGPLGWGVWLAGLAYCNRNLTDGFIPWAKARTLASFDVVDEDGTQWSLSRASGMAGEGIDADWVIGLLVGAGLWDVVDNGKGRTDGFRVHDYEDYQPSAEKVGAEREANARRQEAWRNRARNVIRNGVTNAVSNGVSNGPVTSPPTQILNPIETTTSSPPTPPPTGNVSANGTTTTTTDQSEPTTDYLAVIGEEVALRVVSDFQRISPNLSASWLRSALAKAPAGIERHRLLSALETGYRQLEETAKATAHGPPEQQIRNWPAFGRRKVLEVLGEATHGE